MVNQIISAYNTAFLFVFIPLNRPEKKVSLSCKVTNVSPAHYFCINFSFIKFWQNEKKYPFNESVWNMEITVLRCINFFLFRFIWCFITLNMEISRRLWVSLMDWWSSVFLCRFLLFFIAMTLRLLLSRTLDVHIERLHIIMFHRTHQTYLAHRSKCITYRTLATIRSSKFLDLKKKSSLELK